MKILHDILKGVDLNPGYAPDNTFIIEHLWTTVSEQSD